MFLLDTRVRYIILSVVIYLSFLYYLNDPLKNSDALQCLGLKCRPYSLIINLLSFTFLSAMMISMGILNKSIYIPGYWYIPIIVIGYFVIYLDWNTNKIVRPEKGKITPPPVEFIAKDRKLTFISTGMSELKDINKAVKIFKQSKCDFVLMHCVSTYPCSDKDLNLNVIQTLRKIFKCKIGYSGHESSVSPSLVAATLGAVSIERHITLDRSMYGSDQAASLEYPGMKNLVDTIRKLNLIIGDGKKVITDIEQEVAKKLRYWL